MNAFVGASVVQDGLAAPAIESLIKSMYETGILRAGCAVLRCEGFDDAIMKEIRSADGPPRIRDILTHNGERSPISYTSALTRSQEVLNDPTATTGVDKAHKV